MAKLKVNGLQIQHNNVEIYGHKKLFKVHSSELIGNINVSIDKANGFVELNIENLSDNIRERFNQLLVDIELEINGGGN